MTDTMLFRAAKAAALADSPDASYADIVRAALEAIREPTDAVLDAGAIVGPDTNGGEFGYGDAHAVFTAMIDAVLSEGQTNG